VAAAVDAGCRAIPSAQSTRKNARAVEVSRVTSFMRWPQDEMLVVGPAYCIQRLDVSCSWDARRQNIAQLNEKLLDPIPKDASDRAGAWVFSRAPNWLAPAIPLAEYAGRANPSACFARTYDFQSTWIHPHRLSSLPRLVVSPTQCASLSHSGMIHSSTLSQVIDRCGTTSCLQAASPIG
jgi:hypothetical protein